MTTQKKFEALKERELNCNSDNELEQIQAEFESLARIDPDGFAQAFMASARQTLKDAKALRIKEQLGELTQIVSMSYIAKNYFNKTKSWFSQRLNEHTVNGKTVRFSQEELQTLEDAMIDISKKIGAFRVSF